jgi:hypothetical protein
MKRITADELRQALDRFEADSDNAPRFCGGCQTNCWPYCGIGSCPRYKSIIALLRTGLMALPSTPEPGS